MEDRRRIYEQVMYGTQDYCVWSDDNFAGLTDWLSYSTIDGFNVARRNGGVKVTRKQITPREAEKLIQTSLTL